MNDGPFSSLQVSASALTAERLRMSVIAGNLANAQVTRTPEGGPYRRRAVVFEPILESESRQLGAAIPRGVRVARVELDRATPFERRHEPGHPDADAEGNVAMPNVNPMFEMVDLITAARSYEANLSAMRAYRELLQRTITMGR
ncbi:MAG TPA: flagellar basal body rod protein FlgC [Planctomycetota bacterium]|nr:flagellar basal body rod protein FlgC [Planctomycetota bacterium]